LPSSTCSCSGWHEAPFASCAAQPHRHPTRRASTRSAATDASLVVTRGGGLEPGARYDLFGGISIGRSADADIRIEDRFASGVHARIYSRGASYYVEDMNSTNGTFLNGGRLDGEAELSDLDELRIGDTEFRFELEVPGA
jgi:pSer/pThr/pTyr-binding forkhead associated (FHA) protein